jgi:hypothetical protein
MSLLVALPSARLRRLLKAGLKRGVGLDELRMILQQDWGLTWESAGAVSLLEQLDLKGWFIYHPELQIWKTRLGRCSTP